MPSLVISQVILHIIGCMPMPIIGIIIGMPMFGIIIGFIMPMWPMWPIIIGFMPMWPIIGFIGIWGMWPIIGFIGIGIGIAFIMVAASYVRPTNAQAFGRRGRSF